MSLPSSRGNLMQLGMAFYSPHVAWGAMSH